MTDATRIAILGGGPIGLTCALLLAQRRIATVVVDARAVEDARRDARLLALSRGSWQVLQPLLADAAPRTAPIRDVYVSSAGEFGATHLSAEDFEGDDLGATVLYGDLMQALAHAAGTQSLIEQRRPCRALPVEQRPDRVRIPLDDSTSIDAPLAIHAEGIGALDLDAAPPSQWAVIADLRVSGPASGAAFERFTREGPLALLPTPATLPGETRGAATRTMALVWCMDEAQATRRLAAPDDAFMRELQQSIGTRIGRVDAIGARRRYPLHQTMREQLRAHRVVALGNAAQTLHPVAGQGFNLGVRDCVTLSDALATHGADVAAALADHETRRGIDRAAIAAVTKWLPAAFATRFAPIAAARGAGLVALDLLPPLRRQLAYLLMFGVRA